MSQLTAFFVLGALGAIGGVLSSSRWNAVLVGLLISAGYYVGLCVGAGA